MSAATAPASRQHNSVSSRITSKAPAIPDPAADAGATSVPCAPVATSTAPTFSARLSLIPSPTTNGRKPSRTSCSTLHLLFRQGFGTDVGHAERSANAARDAGTIAGQQHLALEIKRSQFRDRGKGFRAWLVGQQQPAREHLTAADANDRAVEVGRLRGLHAQRSNPPTKLATMTSPQAWRQPMPGHILGAEQARPSRRIRVIASPTGYPMEGGAPPHAPVTPPRTARTTRPTIRLSPAALPPRQSQSATPHAIAPRLPTPPSFPPLPMR